MVKPKVDIDNSLIERYLIKFLTYLVFIEYNFFRWKSASQSVPVKMWDQCLQIRSATKK